MAGSVLNWTFGFQINNSAKLKVSASKSATSPSCKPLSGSWKPKLRRRNPLKTSICFRKKLTKLKREKRKRQQKLESWNLKSRSVKIEVENQKLGKQKREIWKREIWNLTIETWKKEAWKLEPNNRKLKANVEVENSKLKYRSVKNLRFNCNSD